MHLLMVDDVADPRFIFRTSFEMAGHTMQLARDGMEAISAVQQQLFDAIIMDLSMPLMDGWQTTQEIRRLPNGAQVPIIIFTAHSPRRLNQKAEQVGANYVLQKPMAPNELREFVEKVVAQHDSHRDTASAYQAPLQKPLSSGMFESVERHMSSCLSNRS